MSDDEVPFGSAEDLSNQQATPAAADTAIDLLSPKFFALLAESQLLMKVRPDDLQAAWRGVANLRADLEQAIGLPVGGEKDMARFEDRITRAGEKRYSDDEIRLFGGGWKEVKTRLQIQLDEVSVALTKWVSSRDEKEAFRKFIDANSEAIRLRFISLAEYLESFGLELTLATASRGRAQTLRVDDDIAWSAWINDSGGQASASVTVRRAVWDLPVATETMQTVRDLFSPEEVAQHLSDARGSADEAAVWEWSTQNLAESDRERLRTAFENLDPSASWEDFAVTLKEVEQRYESAWKSLLASGKLREVVLYSASVFGEILRDFRASSEPRLLEVPDPLDLKSVTDTMFEGIVNDFPSLTQERPAGIEATFGVYPNRAGFTIGWNDKSHPHLEVQGNVLGSVAFSMRLGKMPRNSAQATPIWFSRISGDLARHAGGRLLSLVNLTPGLSFKPDDLRSQEEIRESWIHSDNHTSLEWSLFKRSDNSLDPELMADAASLFAWLFSAVTSAPQATRPLIPEPKRLLWEGFISLATNPTWSFGSFLNDFLETQNFKIWFMKGQQVAGKAVPENNRDGVLRSKSFIALLTSEYWASGYCVDEWVAAVRSERPILPVIAHQEEGQGGIDAFLKRLEEESEGALLSRLGNEDRAVIQEILESTKTVLGGEGIQIRVDLTREDSWGEGAENVGKGIRDSLGLMPD
jgi:hypothetical protein